MNTLEKLDVKILDYVKKNFGSDKKYEKVENLSLFQPHVEIYGFNSIQIAVKEDGDTVYYRPIFFKGVK